MKPTRRFLPAVFVVAVALPVVAQQRCSQEHPKRAERLHMSVKDGDVKVCKGIAGHTVRNAIEYYGLEDLVSAEEMTSAANQMYTFLKWKLGSPSLVAAQFVSTGYEHFEKSYRDEAAGMLLGVLDFTDRQPELKVPPFLLDWINGKVGKSGEAATAFLVSKGVPEFLAKALGEQVEKALANLVERNKVGIYIPKKFDIDNELVETAVAARRSPAAGPKGGGILSGKIPDLRGPRSGRTGSGNGKDGSGGPLGLPDVGGSSSDRSDLAARVVALEARVQQLERLVRQGSGPSVEDGGQAVPAAGYERLVLSCKTWGRGRLVVSVNGVQVSVLDTNRTLELTPLLVAGRANRLEFAFQPQPGADLGSVEVALQGYLQGVSDPLPFYSFAPTKDRLHDEVEVVRAGG